METKSFLIDALRTYLQLVVFGIAFVVISPISVLFVAYEHFRRPSGARSAGPRSVLITGASSGIGEALAVEYASRGDRVIITGRNTTRLSKVKTKCLTLGASDVIAEIIDVADEKRMKNFIEGTWRKHPIDIVIANAGIGIVSYTFQSYLFGFDCSAQKLLFVPSVASLFGEGWIRRGKRGY
mmetsp:Transcript_39219/g.155590  ORF Transcript_39219/g.155590 Transcript_39219/m.155590 type:complete len:182 (-) Transcript_39219:5043-5588(-)